MEAKLGRKYRIGGDGWWYLEPGVPILVTDEIQVSSRNPTGVVIEVKRDGELLGHKAMHPTFFQQDFELID